MTFSGNPLPLPPQVSGTCAKLFKSEVQFGHAGAKSGGEEESAQVRAGVQGCRGAGGAAHSPILILRPFSAAIFCLCGSLPPNWERR